VATPVSAGASRQHAGKFIALYAILVIAAGGAIGIGVHVATETTPKPPGPWSAWRPTTTDVKAVDQIANYVGAQYLGPKGKQLIDVRGTPLIMGSKAVKIAVRPSAQAHTVSGVAGTSVEYNMCGSTASCSVPKGISATAAGVLTRREAYQIALLTFKYVPAVSNVVVLTPPLVAKTKARAIFIRRDDVQRALDAPAMVIPGDSTRISHVSQREAQLVAKATDPFIYQWILAQVGSTPTLVINPITLDVKDSLTG
jgi:hypothetical protein